MGRGKSVRWSGLCFKNGNYEQSERWIKEEKELITYGKPILWNASWNYHQVLIILYLNLSTSRWDSFAIIFKYPWVLNNRSKPFIAQRVLMQLS